MDLIDRQAAMESLTREYNRKGSGEGLRLAWIEKAINEVPPAGLMKTGEWISHGVGHEHIPWGFDCSNCGKWFVIGKDIAEEYNYCPHCGARMEVEHDGIQD